MIRRERPEVFPFESITGIRSQPVVDTFVDKIGFGPETGSTAMERIYLAESDLAAALIAMHWPTPEEYARLEEINLDLLTQVETLTAEVEYEKEHKLVDPKAFVEAAAELAKSKYGKGKGNPGKVEMERRAQEAEVVTEPVAEPEPVVVAVEDKPKRTWGRR